MASARLKGPAISCNTIGRHLLPTQNSSMPNAVDRGHEPVMPKQRHIYKFPSFSAPYDLASYVSDSRLDHSLSPNPTKMLLRRLPMQNAAVRAQAYVVEKSSNLRHDIPNHFPLFVNSSNAEKSPSSIFFQTASIRALRSRLVSRFFLLFFPLSVDKHLLTSRFISLQPPKTLKRKPRAWHSSRAFMISSQPARVGNYQHICHRNCRKSPSDLVKYKNTVPSTVSGA